MSLDREELSALRSLALVGGWTLAHIYRSGGGEGMRQARQRLKRRGLIESHPVRRRTWRVTEAGRIALQEARA